MKKEIKVKLTFTEGYQERFTKACIRVAKKREESGQEEVRKKEMVKTAGYS